MIVKESHLCGKSQQFVTSNASPSCVWQFVNPSALPSCVWHPWRKAKGSAYYRAAKYNVSWNKLKFQLNQSTKKAAGQEGRPHPTWKSCVMAVLTTDSSLTEKSQDSSSCFLVTQAKTQSDPLISPHLCKLNWELFPSRNYQEYDDTWFKFTKTHSSQAASHNLNTFWYIQSSIAIIIGFQNIVTTSKRSHLSDESSNLSLLVNFLSPCICLSYTFKEMKSYSVAVTWLQYQTI